VLAVETAPGGYAAKPACADSPTRVGATFACWARLVLASGSPKDAAALQAASHRHEARQTWSD